MKKLKCPIGFIEVNGRCVKRHEVNQFLQQSFDPINSFNGGGSGGGGGGGDNHKSNKTRKSAKSSSNTAEIIGAIVGGVGAVEGARRGVKRISRTQRQQRLDAEYERESLLAEQNAVEQMEEGIEMESDFDTTPLLQRQDATDRILRTGDYTDSPTIRTTRAMTNQFEELEMGNLGEDVSAPADLDAPVINQNRQFEIEFRKGFYDEVPDKDVSRMVKLSKEGMAQRQKIRMNEDLDRYFTDVDLETEYDLTPEEEAQLEREMATREFQQRQGLLEGKKTDLQELYEEIGMEEPIEIDPKTAVMNVEDTAEATGVDERIIRYFDAGEEDKALELFEQLKLEGDVDYDWILGGGQGDVTIGDIMDDDEPEPDPLGLDDDEPDPVEPNEPNEPTEPTEPDAEPEPDPVEPDPVEPDVEPDPVEPDPVEPDVEPIDTGAGGGGAEIKPSGDFKTIKSNVGDFKPGDNPFLTAKNTDAPRISQVGGDTDIGKEYFADWLDGEGEVDMEAVKKGLIKAGVNDEADLVFAGVEALDLGAASATGIFSALDYAVTGEGNEAIAIASGAAGTLGLITAMASAVVGEGSAIATGGASIVVGGALYGIGKGVESLYTNNSHKDRDYTLDRNKELGSRQLDEKEIKYFAHSIKEQMDFYEDKYKYQWSPEGNISLEQHEKDKIMYQVFKNNYKQIEFAVNNKTPLVAIIDPETGVASTFIKPIDEKSLQDEQLQMYKDKNWWNYLTDDELKLIGLSNIADKRNYDKKMADFMNQEKSDKFDSEREKGLSSILLKGGIDLDDRHQEMFIAYKLAKQDGTEEAMIEFNEKYAAAPYEVARMERQIEADANDGNIQVYTEGIFKGMTQGEAEIASQDDRFIASHSDLLAESEGHGEHQNDDNE